MKCTNQNGVTLIELMISMVIGIFLVGAIGSVYLASQETYRVSELVSRMQDSGRVAMQILTEDLQMAGFLGNSMNPNFVTVPSTLPAATGDCATGWYTNMNSLLTIGNNTTPTVNGTDFATTCLSTANYHTNTDSIALKRAANANIPGPQLTSIDHQNWLLLRTDTMRGEFFTGGGGQPAGFATAVTDRRWLAHFISFPIYFISYLFHFL